MNKYGFGETPPFSLYQDENSKWGLIDGKGRKLPTDFDRIDEDRFSCVPWEVVTFDEKEGFELLAWYDPCEVWFNFTFDNPDYPEAFGRFLWKATSHSLQEEIDRVLAFIPPENHWLIDCMVMVTKENLEDEEFDECLRQMLSQYPVLEQPSRLNSLLDPIMRNGEVDDEIKRVLWRSKVQLDYSIRSFQENITE